MEELKKLLPNYIDEGFYEGSLMVAEHIYRIEQSKEMLFYIIESLFHLRFYERCEDVCQRHPQMLNFFEVKKIFLICKEIKNERNADFDLLCGVEFKRGIRTKAKLKNESVIRTIFTRNSDMLKEAFNYDNRNFEALFLLFKNDLVEKKEIQNIVSMMGDPRLSAVYSDILFGPKKKDFIFSPFSFFMLACECYVYSDSSELFNLGLFMIKNYKSSEYSYFVFGLNYLISSNYEGARKCFYMAVKTNDDFGMGWVALGITYSKLRESISAFECFKKANKFMTGSARPSMLIAFEYHKINDCESAESCYRKAISMEKNSFIVQKYGSFLISCEKYKEALQVLTYENTDKEEKYLKNTSSLNLLRCFCLLFMDRLKEAKKYVKSGNEDDWKCDVTKGFISQIENNLEEATKFYHQGLIKTRQVPVVHNLLTHALDVLSGKEENVAFNYATELFEALDLKSVDVDYVV